MTLTYLRLLPLFTAERAMFRTTSLSTASSTDRSGSEKVGECRDDEDEREERDIGMAGSRAIMVFNCL